MASDAEPVFYVLEDQQLNRLATAAPLRTPRRGKADIGGRMRVAQILRSAGVGSSVMPERIAGSTNEVWKSGDLIVRVGLTPGADRLRREAMLARHLPLEARYPRVLGAGTEEFGEWIVVRNIPGMVLAQGWAHMDAGQRKASVFDLGEALHAVHTTPFSDDQRAELELHEGEGSLAAPHQLPVARIVELLHEAALVSHMDQGLVRAAIERAEALDGIILPRERFGLVHGDLHFENVLAKDGVFVALLDFEWARFGPREIDLDVLARFCAEPAMHIGGEYPVRREDFADVLRWLAEAYPELFADPLIKERLLLCSLAFEVPWLLKVPPTGPLSTLAEFHPANQLKALLDKGTHAERLGWGPKDAYSF